MIQVSDIELLQNYLRLRVVVDINHFRSNHYFTEIIGPAGLLRCLKMN